MQDITNTPEPWEENIRMLESSLGAVVPEDGALHRIRDLRGVAPGFDRETWSVIAAMGWLAIRIREEQGGLGLGLREASALCEGLGRGLVPEPVISALLALRLMAQAGAEIPEAVLAGDRIALAAWQGRAGSSDPAAGVLCRDGRLTGRKIAVEGGAGADLFVVTLADGIALVPKDEVALSLCTQPMHDGTLLAQLDFAGVAAERLPCAGIADILGEAMLMHGAYLLGLSERAFGITLDYLRVRKQFGGPIGQFQALQHRATEIKLQLELTRAAIAAAAGMFDRSADPRQTRMAILRARCRAGNAARLVAREAIQMHGAMGYTDEADIGLFTRKAMVVSGLFGSDRHLRKQFADLRDQVEDAA